VYRQQITNIVNRVNSVYNDTILNRIYTNAGKVRLMGSEVEVTISLVKKQKSLWVETLFSSTLSTQFNLTYLLARNTAQGEDSRFYQPNFSVKKSLIQFAIE